MVVPRAFVPSGHSVAGVPSGLLAGGAAVLGEVSDPSLESGAVSSSPTAGSEPLSGYPRSICKIASAVGSP